MELHLGRLAWSRHDGNSVQRQVVPSLGIEQKHVASGLFVVPHTPPQGVHDGSLQTQKFWSRVNPEGHSGTQMFRSEQYVVLVGHSQAQKLLGLRCVLGGLHGVKHCPPQHSVPDTQQLFPQVVVPVGHSHWQVFVLNPVLGGLHVVGGH